MAIIDQNGNTVSSIWYYFHKGSNDIQISDYAPSMSGAIIFGPYSVTHETPPDVLNEMRSRVIEAGIMPAQELKTSKPRKIAK